MRAHRRPPAIQVKDLLRAAPTPKTSRRAVRRAARAYRKAGLSLIPISADGTKMPAWDLLPIVWDESRQKNTRPWKGYRQRRPTSAELEAWFRESWGHYGLAILCGEVSGNLEVIDLDNWDAVTLWVPLVEQHAPGLLDRLVLVRTPRPGLHVYYRCPTIGRNEKLARIPDPVHDGKQPKTVIETKGEGGYCLAPPSPPGCHPTGRKYTVVSDHDLTQVPTISPQERELLLDCARQLNQWSPPKPKHQPIQTKPPSDQSGLRPGDDFNARATWDQILEPHGWAHQGQGDGETTIWCRPGKDMGASATTNYNGCGLLYVFSSSAPPFEEGTAYTKFHAYTLLEHGGDFRQAALALSNLGYGASQLGTLRGPADSLRRYASYERLSLGSGGIHDHGGVE